MEWRSEGILIGFLKSVFSSNQCKVRSVNPTRGADLDRPESLAIKSPQCSTSHLLMRDLPLDLNLYFSAWMIGTDSTVEMTPNKAERQLLIAMEEVMNSNSGDTGVLPRVPAVIPRLLQSLRDENVTTAKIAQKITQDPTFVGEVIRVANSSYYRTAIPTSILEQALIKLGHDGLRQVIATIAFRSIIDIRTGHFQGMGAPLLWKQTEKSAQAARCLASREGADIFDAYLAALVQNIGVTVALKVFDKHLDINDAPRSTAFHQAMGLITRKLTLHIVKSWDFPPDIVAAIEEQVDIDSVGTVSQLGSVIYAADRLSKLFMLVENKRIQFDLDQIIKDPSADQQNSCAHCYKELTALAQDS